MNNFKVSQSAIDEVARLEESDRQLYERNKRDKELYLNECSIDGLALGNLMELPIWARTYIIHLRKKIDNDRERDAGYPV